MGVTPSEQTAIQRRVDTAGPEELAKLHQSAEGNLRAMSIMARLIPLSSEELKAANTAIELLARIEAKQQGGGWWFRTKRRFQLTNLYFRS